jgi:predicted DCC family thiol-disulfide oxidoreductase YuxK
MAVMVYDGDCNFCSRCVHRWHHSTDGYLEYLPFQDPAVAARFPEVPRREFETAVQLVETDGSVYGGAEAIFRALAHRPHKGWLLDWYLRSPVFARTSEWGYALVARHRPLLSRFTRLAGSSHARSSPRAVSAANRRARQAAGSAGLAGSCHVPRRKPFDGRYNRL